MAALSQKCDSVWPSSPFCCRETLLSVTFRSGPVPREHVKEGRTVPSGHAERGDHDDPDRRPGHGPRAGPARGPAPPPQPARGPGSDGSRVRPDGSADRRGDHHFRRAARHEPAVGVRRDRDLGRGGVNPATAETTHHPSPRKGTSMSEFALKTYARVMSLMVGVKEKDRGATAVEYGLMVALIAAVIIVSVTALGANLSTKFGDVATKIANAGAAAA